VFSGERLKSRHEQLQYKEEAASLRSSQYRCTRKNCTRFLVPQLSWAYLLVLTKVDKLVESQLMIKKVVAKQYDTVGVFHLLRADREIQWG
jgi:hypothetical protein